MGTVFIKPNTKKAHYGNVAAISAIEPPVWLILLSQTVPEGVVIDMEADGLDHDGLARRLSSMTFSRVVILATGSHPSAHIQQAQAALALKTFLVATFSVPVDVYDHLPFDPASVGAIDWTRVPLEKYRTHNWHGWGSADRSYGATFTSISCPFTCDFCCVRDFYGSGYRQRPPEHIVADIRALVTRGITHIKMMDELFAIDNPGVRAVCDQLAASGLGEKINIWAYARIDTVNEDLLKKMRAAGVRWLAYGIESGNEQIRAGVTKGKFTNARVREVVAMTHAAGIHVLGNFMFGFWDDDLNTMRETLDFAKELGLECVNFYCMSVYKGSKLYDEMTARGVDLPSTGEEYAQMSPKFKPVPTAKVAGHEVLKFRDAAFIEYFTAEKYLSMMERTFGRSVADEIQAMTAIDLRERS